MDKKKIRLACIHAGATVLAVGGFVLEEEEEEEDRVYIPRQPHLIADDQREFFINSLFDRGDRYIVEQFRMKPMVFNRLCDILTRYELLRSTTNMTVKEQVIIFLRLVGHNMRFRVVAGELFRSVETVHRYFKIVLQAIRKLYRHLIRDPESSTPPEIVKNDRFYPYFEDCVGAIDGTHIPATVPIEIQGKFRGRKEGTTQNVLAAITFDLKFTYVLAGWEGTAHDSRVLNDALARPGGFQIPEGKYYLGDAGYGIRNGIITPYRGVRYHLNEFSNNPPKNEKELFNLRHSSLRTTIERGFGILKKRFRSLDCKPHWSYGTQVDAVLASVILHNHIMGIDPNDHLMEEVLREDQQDTPRTRMSQREEKEENRVWAIKRDSIALAMWSRYRNLSR